MLPATARNLVALALPVALLAACSGGDSADPAAEGTAAPAAAAAAGEAPPILKEREENFEAIGKAFKAVRGQLDADSPDFALIATSATDINTRAGKITGHFPAGTSTADGFKTEALPAIWEKPEEFKAAAQKLVDESAKLASLAPGGDKAAVGAQAMAMGGACKGCHDKFRVDDKK